MEFDLERAFLTGILVVPLLLSGRVVARKGA